MNKLGDVVTYVKERIPREELSLESYISNDNLKQNKEGKEDAVSLPATSNTVPAYINNDILIGNIRPYLKKIWFADSSGGHSADVLNLRVKKGVWSRFIYYNCFQDEFFDHMMKGSKGSKMPRGDKDQILTFPIPDYSYGYQKQIAKVLSDLDAKIEINNKINIELETITKLIFYYWFVQFDFPSASGKPYKSSGGKMVYNELLKREIPFGWEVVELKDYVKSKRGVSYSGEDIDEEGIPMINLNSFNTDSTYKPDGLKLFSGVYNDSKVLKPLDLVMCNTQQTALNPKTDIVGKSFLVPDIFKGEIVSSHHITTIKVEKDNLKYYLNTLFNTDYFHRYISGYASGTNIIGLDFSGVTSYKTEIPSDKLLNKYKSIVVNAERQKSIAIKENQKLAELRDWLLPLLINGQVTVGEIKKDAATSINNMEAMDTLFETINFDYEVAAIQLLTESRFSFTYGKKYTHKMFSNIELLNTMPKLNQLVFEEKGWGMFSKAIAKTIDTQRFVCQHQLDNGTKVLRVKSSAFKEVLEWTVQKENKEFVEQVNAMLDLYEKPLINKDMDRIELFNTVLECIKVLKTDSLQSIRSKMAQWPMEEGSYRSKAEKFSENETMHMIGFIKENYQNAN